MYFENPYGENFQACSLKEFNFVYSHLRMDSTSNYSPKAIKCLMSSYYARKLVEESKHIKAVTALSHLKEFVSLSQPIIIFAVGVMKETLLHGLKTVNS
jgi:hypothetical protein